MAKRNSKANSRKGKRSTTRRKKRGLGTILLFWPMLLFGRLTEPLPGAARWISRIFGYPAILALYAILPLAAIYHARARGYDMAKVEEMPERSVILDRRGRELGRIHGEKRDIIDFSQIDQDFIYAILAREDERFFRHRGVDWIGFGRATLRNLKDRDMTQGASTLTMQLARNSYDLYAPWLSFSDTLRELDRKFLEIAVAFRIERNYSKEEVLEHYVNRIFWGHTIRGIEEAARTYYEKSASDLTLSEAALLAGIVRGPNAFSPFKDLSDALRERDATLDRMVIADFITPKQAAAAKAEEINVRPEWRRVFHDSWAMDAVRRELERILEDEDIEFGGLQITTTIDSLLQKRAEEALNSHLRSIERRRGYPHQTRAAWQELPEPRPVPEYLQGSVVVIENLTGAIVATVGGRDPDESKFNRSTQAKRQVGSTFKPFVYLAAFDAGLRPDMLVSDDPLRRGEIRRAGSWSPANSDGTFNGYQTVSYGLIRSRNTMTVRVGNYAGLEKVTELAKQVGFKNEVQPYPTSFLGTLDASPEEVASAYTIFPNGGQRFPPRIISEIRDRSGEVQYSNPRLSYQACGHGAAWTTSQILSDVIDSGTGASVRRLGFTKPCGGKTGTTDNYKDAWFTGFTSSLSCAVWVGFDQPKKIIDRGYGSVLALPVWTEVMKTADRLDYKAEGLRSKLSFSDVRLCRISGKRATEGCEIAGEAYTDSVPHDLLPPANALCPDHAGTPSDSGGPPPKARPVEEAPKAQPVNSTPRAVPVEPPAPRPPRAQPVNPSRPPRAVPIDEPVPRAVPVD
ncbi:transglycosylase domain-containing protein [Haloferula sp. A504]|uniref:transglycosylase domain-containing protein n=1 Tax=Haloferula sp. A504 TaxID=3373601 RepID=UPI0031CA18CE|nr:transglycosylase domain-containing protein [Verrucomicrobiaceae bacterium E54]